MWKEQCQATAANLGEEICCVIDSSAWIQSKQEGAYLPRFDEAGEPTEEVDVILRLVTGEQQTGTIAAAPRLAILDRTKIFLDVSSVHAHYTKRQYKHIEMVLRAHCYDVASESVSTCRRQEAGPGSFH